MGIFGIKREKVKDIRRERARETLKLRKEERELKQKTERVKADTAYYQAKAARKKAKRASSFKWPAIRVRKKKQGRKLSRKGRIRLI